MAARKTKAQVGARYGFRSGLERVNAQFLEEQGVKVEYEEYKLSYTKPARLSKYTPDFILPNGIIIETKGRFVTADRQKHILISKEHPDLDIRFVFSNPNTRISKTSMTSYAKWCDTHNFQYSSKVIPTAWINEAPSPVTVQATIDILGWNPPKG